MAKSKYEYGGVDGGVEDDGGESHAWWEGGMIDSKLFWGFDYEQTDEGTKERRNEWTNNCNRAIFVATLKDTVVCAEI